MRRPARWAFWPCVLVFACAPGRATEPDGAVALRATREDADHVRLTIRAIAPLERVVVTWTGPQGLVLKAELPEGTPQEKTPEPIAGGERLALPTLAGGSLQTVRLRLEGTPKEGAPGIAVVRVEGLLRGQPVREALAIPLEVPDRGRLRGNVLEFPAAVEP
jgi:hypothetical protein